MSDIVETSIVKTLIYQTIINHSLFDTWVTANYPTNDTDDFVAESGSDTPPDKIIFPAIRYRVVSNLPHGKEMKEVRDVIFDVYFDSKKNGTDEVDELMDLIRDIFTDMDGRTVGIYSESQDYEDIVGENMSVRMWDIDEISNGVSSMGNQIGESSSNPGGGNVAKTKFGYIRFLMNVAKA